MKWESNGKRKGERERKRGGARQERELKSRENCVVFDQWVSLIRYMLQIRIANNASNQFERFFLLLLLLVIGDLFIVYC